jgi:hypothetical protein
MEWDAAIADRAVTLDGTAAGPEVRADRAGPTSSDALAGQGAPCNGPAECATGRCSDGVCCDTACAEACHACNLPASPGVCLPEPAGAICGAPSCSGSRAQTPSICDAVGSCVSGYSEDCGAYLCSGNVCGAACTSAAQCVSGSVCSGGACVAGAPKDGGAAPDGAPGTLLVDDFSDPDLLTNNLGGAVSADNETTTLVAGEQKLVWNGVGTSQDFDEGFRANRCEYDLGGYTRLRVRLRSSIAGRRVAVLLALGDGACKQNGLIRQTTITLSTTMTSYEVDLSRTARDKTLFVQFAPTSVDTAEYYLDDIVLAP